MNSINWNQPDLNQSQVVKILMHRLPNNTYKNDDCKVEEVYYNFNVLKESHTKMQDYQRTRKISLQRSTSEASIEIIKAFFYSCFFTDERVKRRYEPDRYECEGQFRTIFSDSGLTQETVDTVRAACISCKKVVFYISLEGPNTHLTVDDHNILVYTCRAGQVTRTAALIASAVIGAIALL